MICSPYIGGVCRSREKLKLSSEEWLAFVERAFRNEASINSLVKKAQADISTIKKYMP